MGIYDKVLDLCHKNRISVSALERESGLKRGVIEKWKVSSPSVTNVEKVANYFGISVDYLLGRTSEGYYIDYDSMQLAQEMKDNPEIQVLLDASRNVSPEDLRFIISMVLRMQKK